MEHVCYRKYFSKETRVWLEIYDSNVSNHRNLFTLWLWVLNLCNFESLSQTKDKGSRRQHNITLKNNSKTQVRWKKIPSKLILVGSSVTVYLPPYKLYEGMTFGQSLLFDSKSMDCGCHIRYSQLNL